MAHYPPIEGVMTPPTANWSLVRELYPGVDVDAQYHPGDSSTKITVSCMIITPDNKQFTFSHTVFIGDEIVVRGTTQKAVYEDGAKRACEELFVSMPENITGKYPLIRIYHDLHLVSQKKTDRMDRLLFGYPDRNIPGWVFPRFKSQDRYPDHRLVNKASLDINGETTGNDLAPTLNQKIKSAERINQKALETAMAAGTKTVKRKKTVSRIDRPLIDPNKVKKPMCSQHDVKMEFDAVENKWRCPIPDCKLVKRPKRDADDMHVVLGKGNVELRYVRQGDEVTIILISDDNVALDVTPFVDPEEIEEVADIKFLAKQADKEGKFNFVVPESHTFNFNTRIAVMGVPEIVKGD